MLFNSFVFLFVFLPVVVVAYFAIPAHRWRLVSIVLASYVFYAYAKWWFALLMVASTLVGYVGGQALERNRSKLLLGVTVASLLARSAVPPSVNDSAVQPGTAFVVTDAESKNSPPARAVSVKASDFPNG